MTVAEACAAWGVTEAALEEALFRKVMKGKVVSLKQTVLLARSVAAEAAPGPI